MSKKKQSSICPDCKKNTVYVIDSRGTNLFRTESVRRRRKCANCHYTYTTYEVRDDLVDTIKSLVEFRAFFDKHMPKLRELFVRI